MKITIWQCLKSAHSYMFIVFEFKISFDQELKKRLNIKSLIN
jgi:hypothetical protein